MNHCEPARLNGRVIKVLHGLSLLALPAFTLGVLNAAPPLRTSIPEPASQAPEPTPYLPVVGSPALRFQEAAPPPDLATRPPAAAPPMPAPTLVDLSETEANPSEPKTIDLVPTPVAPPPAKSAAESPAAEPPVPAAKTPPPILRDEIRSSVRPEDFLPYFQIPGSDQSSPDVTLLAPAPRSAPAPAPLPRSSATYTQTPK